MSLAPRLWVETVIVTTVLLIVVYALSEGGGSAEILSALTLFAAAAFRMIPSMNRIIIAFNGIKNGAHAVGYVAQWITEWPAYHGEVKKALGHAAETEIVGFIHIGSATEAPQERKRVGAESVVSEWAG